MTITRKLYWVSGGAVGLGVLCMVMAVLNWRVGSYDLMKINMATVVLNVFIFIMSWRTRHSIHKREAVRREIAALQASDEDCLEQADPGEGWDR